MKDWKKENRCMMEIFYWFDINGKLKVEVLKAKECF